MAKTCCKNHFFPAAADTTRPAAELGPWCQQQEKDFL
jgi:hypothetical protein